MIENRNPRCDLFAAILFVVALFLSVSLLTYDPADAVGEWFKSFDRFYQADVLVWPQNTTVNNACGYLGAALADLLFTSLGIGAFFLVIGIGVVAVSLLQKQTMESLWTKSLGWLLTLLGMTTLVSMLIPEATLGPIIGAGGYLGALGAGLMKMLFAGTGGLILAASVLAIGLFLWTEYILIKMVVGVLVGGMSAFSWAAPSDLWERIRTRLQAEASDADYEDEEDEEVAEEDDRRRSIFADDDESNQSQVESGEGEDEEAWYDEELEEGPETLPFVTKMAAKSTTVVEEEEAVAEEEDDDDEDEEESEEEATPKRGKLFGLVRKKKSEEEEVREEVISRLNEASRKEDTDDYDLPSLDLLNVTESMDDTEVLKEVRVRGRLLEKKFAEFGQNIRVVDVETGPVITQYELDLEKGLRLNKVTALSDDIAIGLRVPSVRIVPSIPGKNTVGIEVPNEKRQMVRLRDVMESSTEVTRKMKIPLFLGQDVSGREMVADLSKLPHLLIAGRTGTGKSVCLNAIINSILMTRRPDEVRMLMIDPKMVELSGYSRLPHLMHPVVTDMRKAEAILAWAVQKMEDRYRLMARAGVRHINSYNQLGEEELMERLQPTDEERDDIPVNMPFIVIVADEMADLMMTAGKEVEAHIIRLAQKSRAVGIHLILATQKPIVQVVTSLIKSNLPARISFQVSSQTDSRVVLDENGAEKLLGNGDMLFLAPGTSKLLRGQGTFVSDEEIDAITEAVSTGEQQFVHELVNMKIEEEEEAGVDDEELAAKLAKRDELYHKAVEIVIAEQRGSCSLLQRALRIGYGRAARVIDHMEEDGVVGPYNGSKHREVIMTIEQWRSFQDGTMGNTDAETEVTVTNDARVSVPAKAPAPAKKSAPARTTPLPTPATLLLPTAKKPETPVFVDVTEDLSETDDEELVDEAEDEEWEYEETEEFEEEDDDQESEQDGDLEPKVAGVITVSVEEDDELAEDEEWEYEEVDEEVDEEDDEYEYVYE